MRKAERKPPDVITNAGNTLFKPSNYRDTETMTLRVAGTREPLLTNFTLHLSFFNLIPGTRTL